MTREVSFTGIKSTRLFQFKSGACANSGYQALSSQCGPACMPLEEEEVEEEDEDGQIVSLGDSRIDVYAAVSLF